MQNRKCKDWLSSYIEYTSEQESPSMFHLWVGISVISATLGRSTHLDRGYYTLYPNLYVVLIAGSARAKKSTSINMGFDLYKRAFPTRTLISQKITPEALIGMMTQQHAAKEEVSGGVIVSDELSVFLSGANKDDGLIQLLTKLYDCPSVFDYHTLSRGKEQCTNVYLVILAGSTPDWIKSSLPAHAIGGGFTSRVIFVYQFGPEKLVPFPHLTQESKRLGEHLVGDLQVIGEMKGEWKWADSGKEWYEKWYCDVFSKNVAKVELTLDGYYGRKHDTLIKVAMCVAASRSDQLALTDEYFQIALGAMNENEKYLPDIVKCVLSNEAGGTNSKVMRMLERRGEMQYSDILRHVSYCMNAQQLNEVIDTLLGEEVVECEIRGGKKWLKVVKRGRR